MDEGLISRAEVAALLFRANDIAETLLRIERLLEDGDDEEEDLEG
jgi:hypothetical protein